MKRIAIAALVLMIGAPASDAAAAVNGAVRLGFVRAPYDNTWDKIDFHILEMYGCAAGKQVTSVSGTWSAMEAEAKLSMSSSSIGWKYATMLDASLGAPAAPQSFVNFNTTTGDLVRLGGSGNAWSSWSGGYYTLETAAWLSPIDPDLTDGFDQTLLATIYVSKGRNVWFTGAANVSVTGDTVPIVWFPEPSTYAMVFAGAVGLLAYAWRKRKRV